MPLCSFLIPFGGWGSNPGMAFLLESELFCALLWDSLCFWGVHFFSKDCKRLLSWLGSCILGQFPAGNSKKKKKTKTASSNVRNNDRRKPRTEKNIHLPPKLDPWGFTSWGGYPARFHLQHEVATRMMKMGYWEMHGKFVEVKNP